MAELPWSKFFWSDWEADQGLRLCSLAAQGLWMRMLCVCAKGNPKGYLAINGQALQSTDIARLCGVSADEVETLMEELSANGVFSRDGRGMVYSRRMVREAKRSATGRKHAKRRWSQTSDNNEEKPPPNGVPNGSPNRDPTTQRPEARGQRKKEPPDGGSKKATRLNADWQLPVEWGDWATANLSLSKSVVTFEADKFRDYWLSVPGQRGVKRDWEATWRNWMRKAAENGSQQAPPRQGRYEGMSPTARQRLQVMQGGGA